jgi:hypothetical protein
MEDNNRLQNALAISALFLEQIGSHREVLKKSSPPATSNQ